MVESVGCPVCGAPMIRAMMKDGGWGHVCPFGCPALPGEGTLAGEAREAAECARAGMGWYALEGADDAAMDRAEACFHRAARACPSDPALGWAELLARFGVREAHADGDRALLLYRRKVDGQRMSEAAGFERLLDIVAGTEWLSYYQAQARRVDRLLDQAFDARAEDQLFLALKTEEGGRAAPEKRFCDALYERLTGTDGLASVFYAPQTLSGCDAESFEPRIHAGLRSARGMVIVAETPAHANAPWVRSEWQRYLAWGDGEAWLCVPEDMDVSALPQQLAALPRLPYDVSEAAERICRTLRTPRPRREADPEALVALARELLDSHPEKAVRLLEQAAEGRSAEAMLLLGRCCEAGIGIQADPGKARRWYLAAAGKGAAGARAALDALALRMEAEKGVPSAQTALGRRCLQGEAQDPAQAARWLRLAAERGDVEAKGLYGCMLMEGHGVAADRRLGRRLLNEARAGGSGEAAAYLNDRRMPW